MVPGLIELYLGKAEQMSDLAPSLGHMWALDRLGSRFSREGFGSSAPTHLFMVIFSMKVMQECRIANACVKVIILISLYYRSEQ